MKEIYEKKQTIGDKEKSIKYRNNYVGGVGNKLRNLDCK
jgi:hypothetical protein